MYIVFQLGKSNVHQIGIERNMITANFVLLQFVTFGHTMGFPSAGSQYRKIKIKQASKGICSLIKKHKKVQCNWFSTLSNLQLHIRGGIKKFVH